MLHPRPVGVKHAVPRRSYTLQQVRYQGVKRGSGPQPLGRTPESCPFRDKSWWGVDRRGTLFLLGRIGAPMESGSPGAAIPMESGRRAVATVRPLPSRRLSDVVQAELQTPSGRRD